jgi:hypothetical protein
LQAQAIVVLVSLASPRFTWVYPTSLGVAWDWVYQAHVPIKQESDMGNGNSVRRSLVIMGLGAFLTLGLPACGYTSDNGSSVPIREQMYGGDNRDLAPAHQEKIREQSNPGSRATTASRS